jgi:glycosyltransferase involved in cell wall biosynthesis
MTDNSLKVSVCMITYNHENYISQAIEGILMQQTTFPFELIIGEDCSSDDTRKICIDYKKRYPDRIRLLLPEDNLGVFRNFVETMNTAKGKYIALCEGDDYWTDLYKLQKQVDFLDANPNFSASAHQSEIINAEGISTQKMVSLYKSDRELTIQDLVQGCNFQTATFIFRKEIIDNAGKLPNNILSCDRLLFLLCAIFGPLMYFADNMSIYRKHEGGISKWVTINLMKKDLNMIPWFKKINPRFPANLYLSHIHYTIFYYANKVPTLQVLKHYSLHLLYGLLSYPKSKEKLKEGFRAFRIVVKPRITNSKFYNILKNKFERIL